MESILDNSSEISTEVVPINTGLPAVASPKQPALTATLPVPDQQGPLTVLQVTTDCFGRRFFGCAEVDEKHAQGLGEPVLVLRR